MSQINTNWEINGNAYPLNMQDVDDAAKYEAAFDAMAEEERAIPKDGRLSDLLRAKADLYRNLFDRLFGNGASLEIFGERNDLTAMDDIYEQFLTFVSKQVDEAKARQSSIIERFSPNRAQRRAANRR
ncbi:MAG: hypothetical protein J6A79_07850 [Clostridia bacterium]|nr:hypothetical protein [Clostridia bacterium]